MHRCLTVLFVGLMAAGSLRADKQAPPTPEEKKALDQIRKLGGLALELAQNDNHLEVSYLQIEGAFSDQYLAPLKDLAKRLVHLNLRGLPVTDAQLAHLEPLTGLTELHLEKTKVTDKGLVHLKPLVNLEYLNLYGTDVSDAGLANLEGMKKLKHLYLWQTKVTAAGAAKLKKALPGVDIDRGLEVTEPPPKTEPGKKAPAKKEPPKKEPPKKAPPKDKKK